MLQCQSKKYSSSAPGKEKLVQLQCVRLTVYTSCSGICYANTKEGRYTLCYCCGFGQEFHQQDKIIKHFLCLSRGKFLRVFFSPDSELYCAFFSIAITENNSTDFRGRFHTYAIKSEILNQHMDMLHVRRAWLV